MRVASQGETAARITLDMMVPPMLLSQNTAGMSQQLEERLVTRAGGFKNDDGFESQETLFCSCATSSSSSVETSPSSFSSSFAINLQNLTLDISENESGLNIYSIYSYILFNEHKVDEMHLNLIISEVCSTFTFSHLNLTY